MRALLIFALISSQPELIANETAETNILRQLHDSAPDHSTIRVHAGQRSPYRIPAEITGKFAEHLGANIYNGMDAQILRNPTFAEYPFWTGQMSPDGITRFFADEEKIGQELRRQASRLGWPDDALESLASAHANSLAAFWTWQGARQNIVASPDTGPFGGRAQRLDVRARNSGIAQWAYLPLHRTRRYEFEIFARSPDLESLSLSIAPKGAAQPAGSAKITGLANDWKKLTGTVELPTDSPTDVIYRIALTADVPGQCVFQRFLLRPADHIHGADVDIVRYLRQSKLPVLRWPGGNFASGYHWEDGIGPSERRPTKPNYAWGGVEPNLFGTDEFMAFCGAVGCEPMICINAGDGGPDEAARWIEYCNGPASSRMGALRAANGHPEPYRVRHWEVGNELWGRWQFHWTTAAGYVDRYRRFAKAMIAADSNIVLYACGAPVLWGKEWNDTLIAGIGASLRATTDHPLIGGQVSPASNPLDVYRDFMAVPELLQQKWAALRAAMSAVKIPQPRLAVTELQLFAHLGNASRLGEGVKLTRENLVNPGTLAEGLYDALIYHAAVRLAPFVSLITHSAVVNHGGGLRKEQERVYANPCYYAQAAFAAFAKATPVAVEIDSASERPARVISDLKNAAADLSFRGVDALAALAPDGSLLLSVVHRGTSGPIRLEIELHDFHAADFADVRVLTGEFPWSANSLTNPTAIKPLDSRVAMQRGKCVVGIPPYTMMRFQFFPEPGRP